MSMPFTQPVLPRLLITHSCGLLTSPAPAPHPQRHAQTDGLNPDLAFCFLHFR